MCCSPEETDAPAGLRKALANGNRLQDILFEEIRPGLTGNEVLRAALAKMGREGLDGTIYTHPIGVNGHGGRPAHRPVGLPGRASPAAAITR
jgi:hypothetical protein